MRRQIAERFLSEGNGEAARIRGNRERDPARIQSGAYRQVEEIRGVADATATAIYAAAYNQSPQAVSTNLPGRWNDQSRKPNESKTRRIP